MPKAVLIDATSRTIKEIEVNNLKDQQDAVGGYIETVHYINHGGEYTTYFYMDEEGRLKTDNSKVINGISLNVPNIEPFLVGNCVVVTLFNPGGDNEKIVDLKLPISEIKKMVSYAISIK